MNDLISEAKQEVLRYCVDKLKKENKYTDYEIKTIEETLKSKLNTEPILTKKVKEVEQTNSTLVNETTENLYLDVFTTFKVNDLLTNIIDEYITMSLFNIKNVDTKLDKCLEKIEDFKEILKTKGNPKIISDGFISNASFETNNTMYRERYGEYVDKVYHARFDFDNKRITLPLLSKVNTTMYDNGVSTGSLKVTKQLGKGFININSSTSLDSVIDTSSKSFWKNTILADSPIKVEFSNEKPTTAKELKNYYYGIKNGALLELELNYESINTINCIQISPCSKYQMELVAIRYSDTDDVNEDLKELVTPDSTDKYLKNKVLDGTIVYNFPDVTCKRIYFIFKQINYERKNFILNTNETIKNEIWLDVIDDTKDTSLYDKDLIFKPNYLDRKINSNYLNDLNKFAINPKSINFYELFYENKKLFKSTLKNAYEFGFYNISTFFIDYANTGIYVSDWIEINQNIAKLSILTDEVHRLSSDGMIDTDIEYYISYAKDPKYYEWYPILPKNIDYIHSEMLQLGTDECLLRFPAKKLISVRMNEVLLKKDEDYIVHGDNGLITSIEIPIFNHRAIYKATYEPDLSAQVIKLIGDGAYSDVMTTTDSILCNGENQYTLNNSPYVNDANLTFVRIVNIETGEVAFQEGHNIYCCTDPSNPTESYKYFFDSEKLKYQYYTYENKIFFNNPIPSNFKIEVTYSHHVSKFRLKAIFRRNNNKDVWLSPVLNKIEYSVTVV